MNAADRPEPIETNPRNILLLSCMDLRLLDETVAYMEHSGLTNRYDHVILAGAALGVVQDRNPHWSRTFWDHLDLARELHDVREVHILEHRECGGYRKMLGVEFGDDHEAEARAHAEVTSRLATMIRDRHPDLAVRQFLMDLAGAVIDLEVPPDSEGRDRFTPAREVSRDSVA